MLRVEPEIKAAYVASGRVSLAFHPMLDHGDASRWSQRAAECAGAQDPLQFWTLHDLLFERQSQLLRAGEAGMVDFAAEIGLDTDAFRACMADPAISAKIERMDQARRNAGIRRRPSFHINGRLLEGAVPFAGFTQAFADAE